MGNKNMHSMVEVPDIFKRCSFFYKWLVIIPIVVTCLCACVTCDNTADNAFKDRYIPMLKQYIQQDPQMDTGLKGVHVFALDEWFKHERGE